MLGEKLVGLLLSDQWHTVTLYKRQTETDLIWFDTEIRLILKGFKWKNHMFFSYSTFIGLKSSIFFYEDQQKCENEKNSLSNH